MDQDSKVRYWLCTLSLTPTIEETYEADILFFLDSEVVSAGSVRLNPTTFNQTSTPAFWYYEGDIPQAAMMDLMKPALGIILLNNNKVLCAGGYSMEDFGFTYYGT